MARRDRFAVKGNQKRGQNRNIGGAPAFVKPPIATKRKISPVQIEQIKQAISQLPPEKIKRVIPQLPPEVIQEVIPQLPPEVVQEVIPQLPPEVRERVINIDKGKGRRQPPVVPPPVAPPPMPQFEEPVITPPSMPQFEEPVYVPPMAQPSSNLTREEIETGVGEQPPVNFYTEAFTANDNQNNRPPVDGPAVDALNLRTDANEAARTATDQYEADVAAYKDTEATEAEQGIASLPQFSADERDMMESGSYDDGSVAAPLVSGTFDPNAVTSWSTDVPSPTGIKAIDDYNTYLATTPTTPTAYSEEPDLSSGTDGMVNMFGDTEAYGGDVINPDPIYQPPVNDGGGPDGYIPLPSPIDDGRPRNIYTGRPIRNPYVPYEEPSKEMAEYTRPMSAERFGASPGMGPQINPPKEPIFANMGGNLDKGLSRLPLNQQNDTLTQIFQNGFRPRR